MKRIRTIMTIAVAMATLTLAAPASFAAGCSKQECKQCCKDGGAACCKDAGHCPRTVEKP